MYLLVNASRQKLRIFDTSEDKYLFFLMIFQLQLFYCI